MTGSKQRPSVLSQHPLFTLMCIHWKAMMRPQDSSIERGYHIHSKKLGEGGFGVVKLATHLLTNQKVAIKIINKKKVGKDLFRVKTEIAALKVLRHKNIAKLLQVVENDEYIYLVLEYCCGGELFDYLVSRSRLSDCESRRVVRSLVRVLAYIHSKGFAHRDIKPENILLDDNHNIKLIDFGLAANSEGSTNGDLDGLSTCCGSPAYVAPEVLKGMKYFGPAADVWSTGVLLYTLVCGKLPFTDKNLPVLYKKIKVGMCDIPSYVHKDTREMIQKMLCVDPKKRITIPEIMQHAWFTGNAFNFQSIGMKLSDMIKKDDESEFDDQILLKCAALFPDHKNLWDLREKIVSNFGYETATYWLVKTNPSQFKDFSTLIRKDTLTRRRSQSFSDFHSPKNKVVVIEEACKAIPNPVTSNGVRNSPKAVKESRDGCLKFKNDKSNTDIKVVPSVHQRHTTAKRTIPINKRLFNDISKEESVSTSSNESKSPCKLIAVSIEDKENIKSPFKNNSLDQAKLADSEMVTPKKSLIKRFLESATPRKCSSPRKFSMNDKKFCLKNIMITNFVDVDECMEEIIKHLSSKQVNCKAKNYTIRCVMSSMNVIIVALELELLVCRTTGYVGIQRKRIRGTSWDYAKICDELSNVQKKCNVDL